MKNKLLVLTQILATVLLWSGCASAPKEKPVLQRGWIGGTYERAKASAPFDGFVADDETIYCFPRGLAPRHKAGILTTSLGTNTPAFLAGLREGDLILEVGHTPVANLPDFWRRVTSTPPGVALSVKSYREGKTTEYIITAGREKYKEQGALVIALPIWESIHPVPTPNDRNFSLGPLGFSQWSEEPVEFASAEQRYKQSCHPKNKQEGADLEWKAWLAIIQVSKYKTILAQESVPAQQ